MIYELVCIRTNCTHHGQEAKVMCGGHKVKVIHVSDSPVYTLLTQHLVKLHVTLWLQYSVYLHRLNAQFIKSIKLDV